MNELDGRYLGSLVQMKPNNYTICHCHLLFFFVACVVQHFHISSIGWIQGWGMVGCVNGVCEFRDALLQVLSSMDKVTKGHVNANGDLEFKAIPSNFESVL